MNLRNPPRLAVPLLKWFGLANNEAFVGDLIEEFCSGRTAGWFWRQTLTAIWTAAKSAKSDFAPLLIGWSAQLLIVEVLVARHVHFGLYGSLVLVAAYVVLLVVAILLELGQWWDILFESFRNNASGSGGVAFVVAIVHLIPVLRDYPVPCGVRDYLAYNLFGLCVDACRVVKSHQRRDPKGGAV